MSVPIRCALNALATSAALVTRGIPSVAAALALVHVIGCSAARPERSSGVLREMLLADQHADLEVATVELTDPGAEELADIWQSCDEQAIPLASRRTLQENGLRAGVLGLVLPDRLLQELESTTPLDRLPLPSAAGDSPAAMPWKFQRLRVRWGQRNEILVSGVRPELTVFLRQDGGLSGKTFAEAQSILAASVAPTSDGAIVLTVAPEVHYGAPKQRYIAGEGTFRLTAARDQFIPSQLAFEVPLSPGETLLVGSRGPDGSFGPSFLNDKSTHRLVMIRLSGTHHESLYPKPTDAGP